MRYTVSVQDVAFPGDWIDLATFRWFVDAKRYAATTSAGITGTIVPDRAVRLSTDDNVNY